MSQLKVDTITDEEGTGSPDFPNGITVNNGTIDNTVIGGSTPAAISGTTLTATGDVTIPDRIIHAGDTDTQIRFPANDTVTVETNGTERMRITSTGNVGIGTSSPTSALHVSRFGFSPSNNDAAALRVEGNFGGGIVFSEGSSRSSVWSPGGNRLSFGVDGSSSGGITEALRIETNGQIRATSGTNWVGTVSQNGFSSIIERGSNSNGEFVRYADGTQICFMQRVAPLDQLVFSFTYPVAFIGTAQGTLASWASLNSAQRAVVASHYTRVMGGTTGSTTGEIIFPNNASGISSADVFLVSFGRWF